MKFVFEYRTSDNVRHDGVVKAPDRDAAYCFLKKQGIRPGRLVVAPGFFNKFFGSYKRWAAIVLLLIASSIFLVAFLIDHRKIEQAEQSSESPLTRRQVYGDPALMEVLARTRYSSVFSTEGDRYLACYAQPAVPFHFDDELTLPAARAKTIGAALEKLVKDNFSPDINFVDGESREEKELKRIVLWMRGELKAYLENGIGTPERFAKRLDERLAAEVKIYERVRNELLRTTNDAEWERGNKQLRAIGAPTIVRPENRPEN